MTITLRDIREMCFLSDVDIDLVTPKDAREAFERVIAHGYMTVSDSVNWVFIGRRDRIDSFRLIAAEPEQYMHVAYALENDGLHSYWLQSDVFDRELGKMRIA